MKIINLTQHQATPEQVAAGVVEPSNKRSIKDLLTFPASDADDPQGVPSAADIESAAEVLAMRAADEGATHAMIGGAPFLMAPLERALRAEGITPLYAFSRRESVEEVQEDGSVTKTQVFRHLGFVPAVNSRSHHD